MGEIEGFVENRGAIFAIFLSILLWYAADYFILYIFKKYDIDSDLAKSAILFLIFIVLIFIAYLRHRHLEKK